MREGVFRGKFPLLARGHLQITSAASGRYNCFAWALGQTERCWLPDPFPEGLYDWPAGVPRSDTLGGWMQAFEALGFSPCDNADVQIGQEKIAIFAHPEGAPRHVARQLASGKWTSKIGTMEASNTISAAWSATVTETLSR